MLRHSMACWRLNRDCERRLASGDAIPERLRYLLPTPAHANAID